MTDPQIKLELRTSPHLHTPLHLRTIMTNVVYALFPLCLFAVYTFGLSALLLIIAVTLSCVGSEYLFNRWSNKKSTLADNSALITGLLLALTLPPGFPLWMGFVAGFVAIALGKTLFGGLGHNVFNPALVGRAFVQAAFPVAITTWHPGFEPNRFTQVIASTLAWPLSMPASVDSISGATPLALFKYDHQSTPPMDLLLGFSDGSAGETSALLILLCGLFLVLRRIMDWRIPLAVLSGAAISSTVFYLWDGQRFPDPLFVVLSGGLMLGAFFMATDPVGAPVTPLGVWVFGLLIGLVTVIIRLFGGQPEGLMYAILLANASTPLIDRLTQPRVYGHSNQRLDP